MQRKRRLRRVLPATLLFVGASLASTFNDPTSHEVGEFPAGVTVGDIDGDGRADIAVATTGEVSLFFNNGSGPGPEQRIDHGPGGARHVEIEDIDDDGDRDLVVLVRSGDSLIVVLRNQGDGTFAPPEPHGAPGFTFSLRLADVDLDGDPDALAVSGIAEGAEVTLLRNDGTGSFEVDGSYLLAAAPEVYVADIGVADLNGDGQLDVAGCVDNSDAVALLLNDGQGGFLSAVAVDLGQRFPKGFRVRDVNDDGRPDLLVSSCFPDELRVGLNDGAGGFVLTDVIPLTGVCQSVTNPTRVTAGYFDADTRIDLAYASGSGDSVRLLHGLGDGHFVPSGILPTDPEPIVVAAGDVNGDGSHDLVSGHMRTGAPDTIVVTTNGQCAPLLDQPMRADSSGVDFSWSTSLPYLAVRGTFVTAKDVGEFAVDRQFLGDAKLLHDADSSMVGTGFWYLIRPDCDGASWVSAGASELPGRDLALP